MGARLPFKQSAAWVALLMLAAWLPATAGAQEKNAAPTPDPKKKLPPLVWDAGVGYTDYSTPIKPGFWYPVWIKMTAGEHPIKGTVRLRQSAGKSMGRGTSDASLMVDVPVDIAPKTTKIYRTYHRIVTLDEWQFVAPLTLRLSARGIPEETLEIAFRPPPQKPPRHVLVLAPERGGYGFLRVQSEDGLHPMVDAPAAQELIYGLTEHLPDDPILLDSLDVIVIDSAVSREISESQWRALEAWTADGGALVLGAGRHAAYMEQSALREPFGLKVPTATAAALPADARDLLVAAKSDPPQEILATWIPQTVAQWERIWVGDRDHPLIAAKRVGQGRLVYCAAALDPWMLRLIEQLDVRDYFIQKLIPRAPGSSERTPLVSLRAQAGQITALQEGFSVNLVGAGWVFMFLLAYNLLAMPLNWWLCRRLGKPGLPWQVLMVAAVGFAWYGYRTGMERQQQNFQVNSLTFLLREQDSPLARAVAYDTIYSPRRLRTDLPSDSLMFPSPAGDGPAARQEFLMTFTAGATVRDWLIHPWTVSNFRTEFSPPAAGLVEAIEPLATGEDGQFMGRLVNGTSMAFSDWWVARGDRIIAGGAGPLQPGTSATLKFLSGQEALLKSPEIVMAALGQHATQPNEPASTFFDPTTAERELNQAIQADPANESHYLRLAEFYRQFGRYDQQADAMSRLARLHTQGAEGRWWFIGIAEGDASPLTAEFANPAGLRRVVYEQPVPMGDEQPLAVVHGTGQIEWTVMARVNGSQVDTSDLSRESSILLPLNTVILDFAPDAAFEIPENYHVELAWRLDSHPLPGQRWEIPGNHPGPMQIAGCPVSIYNYRMRTWEHLGDWIGDHRRSGPAADYLHPVEKGLRLRLDTNPESLKMRRSNAETGGAQSDTLVTAAQLFGDQIQATTSIRIPPSPEMGPPIAVSLREISIELIPPSSPHVIGNPGGAVP